MKKLALAIAIVAALAISLSLFVARRGAVAGASDASYVPGSRCKGCHSKQYKGWAGTPHANSFDNLKEAGEESNAGCLPCHTTGYGKPGGFVDAKSTADLAGITCQACHGPGSAHIAHNLSKEQRRATIERLPKDACIKCHRPHEAHPNIGAKELPALKMKLENLQRKIKALGG